jgi:hypothetical protein
VEQVCLSEYSDSYDAHRQLSRFIEDVYSIKRLYSAIGYVPPVEFEVGIALAEREGHRPGAGYAASHTVTATATDQPAAAHAMTC